MATNVGERPEVRMAAMGLLFMSNAPLSVWQKIVASTWFEPSQQVVTWIHTWIFSLTKAPATTPILEELYVK